MEINDLQTLMSALEILKNRLSENVITIKSTTKRGDGFIFEENTFQHNKILLQENQENLLLQKSFTAFLSKYLNASIHSFKGAAKPTENVETPGVSVKQNPVEKDKTEEDYFVEIIEGKRTLESNLKFLNNPELLNNLLDYYMRDELYENCVLVKQQINNTVHVEK